MDFEVGDTRHSSAHILRGSSREMGWRSALVEEFAVSSDSQEFAIAPMDAQRVVLTTAGLRHIESGADGRWRAAVYSSGSIGMTAPGVPVRLRWRSLDPTPSRELHIHLPGSTMRRVAEQISHAGATSALADALSLTDPVLENLLLALSRAASADASSLYVDLATEFLAVHLLLVSGLRPQHVSFGRENLRISRALQFMRENLQRSLTLNEVAQAADLTPYYFARMFKANTGRTVFRYLKDLRIEEACRHLIRETASISEIAYLCGFSSHSALSTAFTKHMGMTPSSYRAQYRL